jgi:hypothetical protein
MSVPDAGCVVHVLSIDLKEHIGLKVKISTQLKRPGDSAFTAAWKTSDQDQVSQFENARVSC